MNFFVKTLYVLLPGNKRIYYLLLCLFLVSVQLASPVDSLKKFLQNTHDDHERCKLLRQLVEEENDDNIWPVYNDEVISISQRNIKDSKPPYTSRDSSFLGFLCDAWSNKGFNSHSRGDYTTAIDFYNKALDLATRIGNNIVIADVYNNLAGVYSDQKQISQAIEYYKRSLTIRLIIKDKEGISQSYSNLATAFETIKDTAIEREYYKKALDVLEGKYPYREGIILVNMSTMFKKRGDVESSLKYAILALNKNKEVGNKRAVSVALGNIANIYIDQKKYAEAKQYATKAMDLARELGIPSHISTQATNLCAIAEAMGDYRTAIKYYRIHIRMRDSIANSENSKLAMHEQLKFEFEKKKAIDDAVHEQELVVAAEREQKQKLLSAGTGFVLFLMMIFAFFIYKRLKITNKQKAVIQEKNHIIEEKQKEIIDSINYAKRIQYALLAHDELLNSQLKEHFVFFKPKDIVSGDFYWATSVNPEINNPKENSSADNFLKTGYFYLAVCDSTGHGVPGAFMSLLNISFLNEAINEKKIYEPHLVLNYVRKRLIDELSADGAQDGMDAVLLCIKREEDQGGNVKLSYSYAAANNHPIIVRRNEFIELPKDKMPVGKGESMQSFTLQTIDAKEGDVLYIYTDGFADQFGGVKGKKFKYKPLNSLLTNNSQLELSDQKLKLEETFNAWKGKLEQVDDVCVLGIRL